jgi:hypothetical protein
MSSFRCSRQRRNDVIVSVKMWKRMNLDIIGHYQSLEAVTSFKQLRKNHYECLNLNAVCCFVLRSCRSTFLSAVFF